jgi:hypothetical protein
LGGNTVVVPLSCVTRHHSASASTRKARESSLIQGQGRRRCHTSALKCQASRKVPNFEDMGAVTTVRDDGVSILKSINGNRSKGFVFVVSAVLHTYAVRVRKPPQRNKKSLSPWGRTTGVNPRTKPSEELLWRSGSLFDCRTTGPPQAQANKPRCDPLGLRWKTGRSSNSALKHAWEHTPCARGVPGPPLSAPDTLQRPKKPGRCEWPGGKKKSMIFARGELLRSSRPGRQRPEEASYRRKDITYHFPRLSSSHPRLTRPTHPFPSPPSRDPNLPHVPTDLLPHSTRYLVFAVSSEP